MVVLPERLHQQNPPFPFICLCLRPCSGKLKTLNYFLKNHAPRVDVIGGLIVYLAGLGAWVLADCILGFQDSRIPRDSRIPGFQDSRIPEIVGLWDFFSSGAGIFNSRILESALFALGVMESWGACLLLLGPVVEF